MEKIVSINHKISTMTNELNRKISPDKLLMVTNNFERKDEQNVFVKMSECDEFIGPKRSKHTMVTYGNILYVFGGDNGLENFILIRKSSLISIAW